MGGAIVGTLIRALAKLVPFGHPPQLSTCTAHDLRLVKIIILGNHASICRIQLLKQRNYSQDIPHSLMKTTFKLSNW